MTVTRQTEQLQTVTLVKPMPRWQRGVLYALLGGVLGFFATQKVPQPENKLVLILLATAGAPIAYQAGVNYSLNNQPHIKDTKENQ